MWFEANTFNAKIYVTAGSTNNNKLQDGGCKNTIVQYNKNNV